MEKHSDLPGIGTPLLERRRSLVAGRFSNPIAFYVRRSGNAEMTKAEGDGR
jgi:hypothetical protein